MGWYGLFLVSKLKLAFSFRSVDEDRLYSDFELIDRTKKAVHYFLTKYSVDKFLEIKKRLEEYKVKQISRD